MKKDSCYKSITAEFLEQTFQWFVPVINEFKQKNHCNEYTWWKSRFHDALNYGGNMTDEQWLLAHTRDISFPYLWKRYRDIFSNHFETKSELKAMPKTFQLELFN